MNLDERKQKILRAVVHEHVRTAEPVASEQIMAAIQIGVKSATIRNEMAEMAELGFLQQPHTSAGRIPSDMGYRFYVDWLMTKPIAMPSTPTIAEATQVREQSAVDDLMAATCHLLSALTHLTALATAPTSDSLTLTWIELRKVSSEKLMVLTLWSNGQLRHAIVHLPSVSESVIQKAGRMLSEDLTGYSQERLCRGFVVADRVAMSEEGRLETVLVEVVRQIAVDASCPEVFIDGTSCFARQPEFREREAMELVLSVLEEHDTVAKLLQAAAVGGQPQVVIGRENPLEPLRSCSLVAASYGTSSGIQGSLGVCGPTRMDYAGVTRAVRFAAKNLSSALSDVLPS